MKHFIGTLLFIVCMILSAFTPSLAAVPTATMSTHALPQTHQIASRRCGQIICHPPTTSTLRVPAVQQGHQIASRRCGQIICHPPVA